MATVKQILSWDYDIYDNLDERALKSAVTTMVSAANKRLRSMEKAGEKSPAYRAVMKSMDVDRGGRFTVKGKSFSQLRTDYVKLTEFLTHKTSTLTGWKKVKRETRKELEKQDVTFSDEEWNDVWDAYEKLEDLDPEIEMKSIKYDVLKLISDKVRESDLSSDEIAVKLKGKAKKLYEKNQQLQGDFENGGVSELFDMQ